MSIAYDTLLTDEFIVAADRPAEVVHDFCQHHCSSDEDDQHQQAASLAEVIFASSNANNNQKELPGSATVASTSANTSLAEDPVAFVIRDVLTPSECDQLIDDAEYFGISEEGEDATGSTKGTKDYINTALSEVVEERIRHVLESPLMTGKEDEDWNTIAKFSNHKNGYMGPEFSIHSDWRILRYDADGGDAFPARQDQMDGVSKPTNDGCGHGNSIVSSHTLLLQLSRDTLEGGGTRLYPEAGMHPVDVALPRGWALIFRQRGPTHAEQPPSVSSPCSKYVARADILRILPERVLQKPVVFRNGVGMTRRNSYEETARIRGGGRVRT